MLLEELCIGGMAPDKDLSYNLSGHRLLPWNRESLAMRNCDLGTRQNNPMPLHQVFAFYIWARTNRFWGVVMSSEPNAHWTRLDIAPSPLKAKIDLKIPQIPSTH